MTVLAFGASNHSASINAALVRFATDRFKSKHQPDAQIRLLNINDFEMPIYSIDREQEHGIPQLAKEFYNAIGSAAALIVSFAEYNGTYSSAWKNIHDWMSRIDMRIYQDKPAVALAATPGPRAGAGVLQAVQTSAPFFGMALQGTVGIGKWGEAFDLQHGVLTQEADLVALDEALAKLAQATRGA